MHCLWLFQTPNHTIKKHIVLLKWKKKNIWIYINLSSLSTKYTLQYTYEFKMSIFFNALSISTQDVVHVSGVDGRNYHIPCPSNCRDNTCHIQNKTCFGCGPEWQGHYAISVFICFWIKWLKLFVFYIKFI